MEDDKVLTPQEIWQMQLEHQRKIEKELDKLKASQDATPEIVPAEPLTEPLKKGDMYCTVDAEGDLNKCSWDYDPIDYFRLKDKKVFPDTPQGKAGAELRAKVFHPGIHWQEDLDKLFEAYSELNIADPEAEFHSVDYIYFFGQMSEFFDKYRKEDTND